MMNESENVLESLCEKNPDTVFCLEIPGTTISYPVMQTKDNSDYYLSDDYNKDYKR